MNYQCFEDGKWVKLFEVGNPESVKWHSEAVSIIIKLLDSGMKKEEILLKLEQLK